MARAQHFEDRVAIVIGGGTGIGASIVRILAELGATIAFSHFQEPAARDVARDARAQGRRCLDHEVDARRVKQLSDFVDEAAQTFGRLDLLVYNAGLTDPRSTLEITEQQWDQTHSINLKGLFFCARQVASVMIAAGYGGSMVFLSSVHSTQAYSDHAHYAASKAGINMLTRSLAAQFGPSGIRVNAVAPGIIYTERARIQQLYDPVAMGAAVPLRRVGTSEDVADAVTFLLSDRASYITGHVLVVDGGLTLPLHLSPQ